VPKNGFRGIKLMKDKDDGETLVLNTGINWDGLLKYLVSLEIDRKEKALLRKVTEQTIKKVAMSAIQQGIWTAISYFSETNNSAGLNIASYFGLSTKNIHEFDWERLEESYGSKDKFKAMYDAMVTPITVAEGASHLVDRYLSSRSSYAVELSSQDEDATFREGIVIGSSLALGIINEISVIEAKELSGLLCADIGLAA